MREHVAHLDLTALLYEAEHALRAIRHGSAGLQPEMDPRPPSRSV